MRAHDNRITGYVVDGRAGRIVLHTENVFAQEPRPTIDLVFSGVEFYCFRCANLISMLLDVQEQPLRSSLLAMADELAEASRRCGWPEQWDLRPERREMSLQALEARGARFFEIESSIGFEGWVVATGFREVGEVVGLLVGKEVRSATEALVFHAFRDPRSSFPSLMSRFESRLPL